MKHIKKTQGFTLIELLIVIGILAVLLAITIIAINPARQFAKANNAAKLAGANSILNAIGQCFAGQKGQFAGDCALTNVAATPKPIGKSGAATTHVDLCGLVSGGYIAALPVAVGTGAPTTTPDLSVGGLCSAVTATADYTNGYNIAKDANNKVTVSASPDTADTSTPTITVTR